jgi:hypothetical protein
MAESSSVRLLQQHLRQAGASLAAREYETASTHIDAALAIDPASLTALTLRERLMAQRAQLHRLNPPASRPVEPASAEPKRFVPAGVNAASWLDFEHRIQERRFRALVDTAERAMAAGDGAGARAAIEEARELQPDAGEVARLSARVAMLQIPTTASREGVFRTRTFRAASLLLVGVTLLMGLDWVRSGTPQPGDRPQLASSASAPEPPAIESKDTSTVPPAQGTSGDAPQRLPLTYRSVASPSTEAPRVEPQSIQVDQPVATAEAPEALSSIPPVRNITVEPILGGEVPDDYVAPRRDPARAIVRPRDTEVATASVPPRPTVPAAPLASVVRQPAPISESLTAPLAPPTAAVSVNPPPATLSTSAPPPSYASIAPVAVSENTRVTAVLNQYATAYGQLNASAVRSIWPSVDERALARAFSDLSSQSMSFDRCDVNVTGPTAHASCRGRASYVVKIGSQERHNEPRTVRFDLKQDGDAWKIVKAETSR